MGKQHHPVFIRLYKSGHHTSLSPTQAAVKLLPLFQVKVPESLAKHRANWPLLQRHCITDLCTSHLFYFPPGSCVQDSKVMGFALVDTTALTGMDTCMLPGPRLHTAPNDSAVIVLPLLFLLLMLLNLYSTSWVTAATVSKHSVGMFLAPLPRKGCTSNCSFVSKIGFPLHTWALKGPPLLLKICYCSRWRHANGNSALTATTAQNRCLCNASWVEASTYLELA